MTQESVTIKDKSFNIYIKESEILERVQALADRINQEYEGKNPLFIAILNGSFMFASDLLKAVTVPCEITFVKVASYEATQSRGEVEEILGLEKDLKDRHIIVIEDIVDTGLTMMEIMKNIREFRPASLEVATFLLKPEALKQPMTLKFIGKEIPNRFVVGYGLDYDGFGRNLRHLYQLA
jgi:hypoxanthine phosphoribosyltransferase